MDRKNAIYDSNYQSTVSSASTTINSLDRTLFNSSKSVVQVSAGSTKALHQVMMVLMELMFTLSNYQFFQHLIQILLMMWAGLGTFGGEISGSNLILKFYPDDQNQQIDIEIFNKSFYSVVDSLNDYEDLVYGPVTDSVDEKFYNAINGIELIELDLH